MIYEYGGEVECVCCTETSHLGEAKSPERLDIGAQAPNKHQARELIFLKTKRVYSVIQ